MDFQQVIVTSRNIVALRHFRNILNDTGKLHGYIFIHPAQFDIAEYHKSLIQFIGIQHSNVLLDVSFPLQPFQPLKHRSRRQADLCRQLFSGQPGILLQSTENLQIHFIQFFCHKNIILLWIVLRQQNYKFFLLNQHYIEQFSIFSSNIGRYNHTNYFCSII